MTFTQSYGAVISPFVKSFKEATTEKARTTVVRVAVDSVKKCKALVEDMEDLPKDLPAVCIFLPLASSHS
jgi:hypothetical protein